MLTEVAMSMSKEMYHRKEAQALLNVSERTMLRLLADPQMRVKLGAKKVGQCWRFIRWQLDAYVTTHVN